MSMLWAMLLSVAQGAAPIRTDGFVIKSDDFRLKVRVFVPPPSQAAPADQRICPVRWVAKDGLAKPDLGGCPAPLLAMVEEDIKKWQTGLEGSVEDGTLLVETWLVFPLADGQPGSVHVRQRTGVQLTLHPEELVAISPSRRLEAKIQVPDLDVPLEQRVTCVVHQEIASSGIPDDVTIEGCDPRLEEATEYAAFRSKYLPIVNDDIPIRSAVSFAVYFDPDGTAVYEYPSEPDIGQRGPENLEDSPYKQAELRKDPTWDPLVEIAHRSFVPVNIYSLSWPDTQAVGTAEYDRLCDLLVQVNSAREVVVWPEECDPSVEAVAVGTVKKWLLKHGEAQRGQRYARFRGTMVFPADGSHVRMRLPSDDLITARRNLPEHIGSFRLATVSKRYPPKVPKAFASERTGAVDCYVNVTVSGTGKPADMAVEEGCDGGYDEFALKAVSKWRWEAAEEDGKAVASRSRVRIKFR